MEREEMISRLREKLTATDPRLRFGLLEAGVRKQGEWWYVPVFAEDRHGVALPRDFVLSTLANVEDALKESDDVNILFVPFIPETSEPAARGFA